MSAEGGKGAAEVSLMFPVQWLYQNNLLQLIMFSKP